MPPDQALATGPQGTGCSPRFKFSIVSSFKDPLTRQLAESVRIERRGMETLNSRLEYSRCRVPRLQIDKEPWLNRKKDGQVKIVNLLGEGSKAREVSEGVEEPEKDMNIPTAKPRDEIPEELRNRVEDEARRLEMKRKGTSERLRPKKKRKFEKLEGWGDPSVESEEKSEVVAMDVGPIEVEETIIDKIQKNLRKPS